MIPILMMIIGGLLIVLSILGILAYIFQPVIEAYQVVIKREDDYAHYISPSGQTFLQTRVRRYLIGILVMFIVGCFLFFGGLYIGYGPKGFDMLFTTRNDETSENDVIDSELAPGFDSRGNFVADDGKVYPHYFIVKGTDIYYIDKYVGDTEALRSYVPNLDIENSFYIVDGYAASSTYKEVMNILSENGFEYAIDE